MAYHFVRTIEVFILVHINESDPYDCAFKEEYESGLGSQYLFLSITFPFIQVHAETINVTLTRLTSDEVVVATKAPVSGKFIFSTSICLTYTTTNNISSHVKKIAAFSIRFAQ